jgi:outer membrane protein TolC
MRSLRPALLALVGLLASSVLLPAQTPAPAVPVSLTTIIHLALTNSTSVRIAMTELDKASAQYAETRQVYIPNLILGSSVGPPAYGFPVGQPSIFSVSSNSLVLSFSQPEYIRAAHSGVLAAQSSLKDAREEVILQAASEYIELDTVSRDLAATEEQQARANRLVEIEKQRVDEGVDPAAELLQARLTAAEVKLKRMHLLTRQATVRQQLASLTGLPAQVIQADPASIPEVPAIKAEQHVGTAPAIDAAYQSALSHQFQAHGDTIAGVRPQISFGVVYNRDAAFSGYENYYKTFQSNNVSAGIQLSLPLYDPVHFSKRKESNAAALRAKIEAEQAAHQGEEQIANLDGTIAELDVMAEVASLRQQIAADQLTTVAVQLQDGNGSSSSQQLSPRAEQQARIEERQRFIEVIDAGFDLTRARLSLMRALGHMEDWMKTLSSSPAETPATTTR